MATRLYARGMLAGGRGEGLGPDVDVRRAQPSDGDALRRLHAESSDSGKVAFRPRYYADPAEARTALRPGTEEFVAVVGAQVVGTGAVTFSKVQAGAQVIGLAWGSGLAVAPQWRRRGVARRLTEAILDAVADRDTPHVVAGAIQVGNKASMSTAMPWVGRTLGTVRVTPVPPPRRRPRSVPGVIVRPATPADLPAVAEGVGGAAQALTLAPAPDVEELASWLAVRVGADLLRSYVVATDASGDVVAGIGIEDEGRLFSLEVTRMPAAIAAANLLVRVVPRDRLMRNLNVRFAWFRPGHEAAARAMWRQVRWDYRNRGTSIVRAVDPTGPLARALPVARWLPSTSLRVVVREPPGVRLPPLPVGAVV
jgi:predicted N-acetyltransferase YhbS